MKLIKKISVLFFFIFIYLLFAGNFSFKFFTNSHNYFNYLAEAFLHGKVYLVSQPSQLLDLSYFNQKLFLYYPPAPAIIFMPFVYFFGTNFSDVFLTAFIGGVNCFVFYQMLIELKKSKVLKLKIENRTIVLMTLLFAFGTNHFYVSLFGGVWWTAHIFAVFFLNFSLYFLFKFLNSKKKLLIGLSTLSFSLAVLSRFSIFPVIFFILFLFFKKCFLKNKTNKITFLYFGIPILLPFLLFLAYNYFRFGSPFDLGYNYFISSKSLRYYIKNFGLFSLVYVPQNLYYYFLHPYKIIKHFPFYKPFHAGNSIFLLTPITLTFFLNWKKGIKKIKQNRSFIFVLITTIILIFLPALLAHSPGGPQIGYRYALDFLPFLLILLLFFVDSFKSKTSLVLLALCFYFGLSSYYIFKYQLFEFF